MSAQTKGRCWTCQRAYEWPAGRTRRLVSMRCPKCAGPLQKTSHQYRGAFRPLPAVVADMIAAGVYDDFGAGAWKR
jgi:predicted amidophosphoribosyltransferase